MKFSHVRAFKAVFELGTVTGAANYLHVTQPAVSHLITALESDLGFRLFDRIKGRLHPTKDADLFYAEVDKVFAGLESLGRSGRAIRDQARSGLAIAAMPMLSNYFIPIVVKELRENGHEIKPLRIMTYRSEEVADRVAMQTCDIGFSLQPTQSADVRCIRVTCQNVCIVPKGDWKWGRKRVVTLEQIGQLPLIRLEREPAQQALDPVLGLYDRQGAGAIEVSFASTVAALVALGEGTAVADPFTAQIATRFNASVVVARISFASPFSFFVLLPQRRPVSATSMTFLLTFDALCKQADIDFLAQKLGASGNPEGEKLGLSDVLASLRPSA